MKIWPFVKVKFQSQKILFEPELWNLLHRFKITFALICDWWTCRVLCRHSILLIHFFAFAWLWPWIKIKTVNFQWRLNSLFDFRKLILVFSGSALISMNREQDWESDFKSSTLGPIALIFIAEYRWRGYFCDVGNLEIRHQNGKRSSEI